MAIVVKAKAPTAAAVLKDGTYKARLTSIRQFSNAYGERMGFEFTIEEGNHAGQTVMRSTAPQLTRQSKLADVIRGMIGRELTEHELVAGFDVEQLVDKTCNILVLQSRGKSGVVYSNVERVFQT